MTTSSTPPDAHEERVLALAGARNLRDLGGYPTTEGQVTRRGMLFRSGALTDLTETSIAALRGLGLKAICDLRTVRERGIAPLTWAAGAGIAVYASDCRASFAELSEMLKIGHRDGNTARAGMIAGYRALPYDLAPAYRHLFACLAQGEIPLLFNCTAGKDRAGTGAALVLAALGVPRQTIVADYVLTDSVYDVEAALAAPRAGFLARHPADVGAAVACADPAYISAALDAVEQGAGGFPGFLRDRLGVDESSLAAIRGRLLVSTAPSN